MVTNTITKKELDSTRTLAEAIDKFFGRNLEGRLCIFEHEAMAGDIAKAYDKLGLEHRRETYRRIAEDFISRTCYIDSRPQNHRLVLDVGCGSGLLSLELTEQTNGIVYGLDKSEDMINLANRNRNERREGIVKKIIKEYEDGGYDFSRPIPAACDPMPEIVDVARYQTDRAKFIQGTVYDLSKLAGNKQCIDFVVCRNALHRFQNPEEAINQMFSVLKDGGRMYLRDLKRDANWKIVLERIGNERWKNEELVRDYIGAMAAMLTEEELSKTLNKLGIEKYKIANGNYWSNGSSSFKEFEKETEYVCVIEK